MTDQPPVAMGGPGDNRPTGPPPDVLQFGPAFASPGVRSRQRPRPWLAAGLTIGAIALVCGGGGIATLALNHDRIAGLAAPSPTPSPPDDHTTPYIKGQCVAGVASIATETHHRVSCKDAVAQAAVTAAIPGDRAQECPPDTDVILSQAGSTACLRLRGAQHRSAPGRGGGIVVDGDCVHPDDIGSGGVVWAEVECGVTKDFVKVTARVDAVSQCRDPAIRTGKLPSAPHPILCLADGPGSAVAGECVGDADSGLDRYLPVDCHSSAAELTVLARRPTEAACSSVPGVTHLLVDNEALPRFRILCVKKVKGQSS